MKNDFQIVTEHPTPRELLAKLITFAPGFLKIWEKSLFRNKNGTYTAHGVFEEFSSYVRDHLDEMEESTRHALFQYVEECVKTNVHSENGISNAARTCFLENISSEGDFSSRVCKYLGLESKKQFDQWN